MDWNTYEAARQGAFDGPVFFWGVVIVAGVLSCIMFYAAMKGGVFKAIFKTICALFKTEVCLNCKYVIPKKLKECPNCGEDGNAERERARELHHEIAALESQIAQLDEESPKEFNDANNAERDE